MIFFKTILQVGGVAMEPSASGDSVTKVNEIKVGKQSIMKMKFHPDIARVVIT
jgi:hypothetical protein